MSAPGAYAVLLSHNSKDKPRVRKLAERLRAQGLRVWFDDWVVRAAVDEDLEQQVDIVSIGIKRRHRVYIAGELYDL